MTSRDRPDERQHVPPELDGTAYGIAKAIWMVLGRSPPLSAGQLEEALNDHENRITTGLQQLRYRGLIQYDETHGGYRRSAGDDDD
jgi:Mn-dependent DtxR family transcriptional regulator